MHRQMMGRFQGGLPNAAITKLFVVFPGRRGLLQNASERGFGVLKREGQAIDRAESWSNRSFTPSLTL